MEKTILKKRVKGLLAFTLAFMLVFGSGLTVLAAEWKGDSLNAGDTITQGDTIVYGSGAIYAIYIDGSLAATGTSGGNDKYTVTQNLRVGRRETLSGSRISWALYLETIQTSTASGSHTHSFASGSHTHSFEWKITREPTEEQDGLYQNICECGHVEASQVVDRAGMLIAKIIKEIKKAPQNGTVTVDSWYLRCLTDKVMEALIARPDVSLNIEFEDKGVSYKVTIPAGMAPTDDQQFYGYYYLGSLYGWQQ